MNQQVSLVLDAIEKNPLLFIAIGLFCAFIGYIMYAILLAPKLVRTENVVNEIKLTADNNEKHILSIKTDMEKRHEESKTDFVASVTKVEKSLERFINTMIFTLTSEIQKNHESNQAEHRVVFEKLDKLHDGYNKNEKRITVLENK